MQWREANRRRKGKQINTEALCQPPPPPGRNQVPASFQFPASKLLRSGNPAMDEAPATLPPPPSAMLQIRYVDGQENGAPDPQSLVFPGPLVGQQQHDRSRTGMPPPPPRPVHRPGEAGTVVRGCPPCKGIVCAPDLYGLLPAPRQCPPSLPPSLPPSVPGTAARTREHVCTQPPANTYVTLGSPGYDCPRVCWWLLTTGMA